MVAIARAVDMDCKVLILDEPTRNFSPLSGPVIRKMIALFPGAVISISHDRKYIEEVCATTYTLTEEGLNKEYFTTLAFFPAFQQPLFVA